MCSAINVTNDAWSQAQLGLNLGVWVFAPSLTMLLQLSLPPCHSPALGMLITSTYNRQWQCSTPRSPPLMPSHAVNFAAAFDLSVISPLNPSLLSEAGLTAGLAAVAVELR